VPLPPDQVERRRQTARALNLGRHLHKGYHGPRWSDADLALLGTAPDAEVAARVGRSAQAVRIKRSRLGIPRRQGTTRTTRNHQGGGADRGRAAGRSIAPVPPPTTEQTTSC
jgi:hypothetical protein